MKEPELTVIKGDDAVLVWSDIHRKTLIDSAYGVISENIGNRSSNILCLAAEPGSRGKARHADFQFPIISVAKRIFTVKQAIEIFSDDFKSIFTEEDLNELMTNYCGRPRINGDEKIYIIVFHDLATHNSTGKPRNWDCSCVEVLVDDEDYRRAATKASWKWRLDLKSATREELLFDAASDDGFEYYASQWDNTVLELLQ